MDHAVMPRCVLGKRKRFPHHPHPPDPLAQGVVPAPHVRGLAGFLADAQVPRFGKGAGVGFPEAAEGAATTVSFGYPAPKHPAGRLAPVAVDVGRYLPRPAAQCRPCPHLVAPLMDITAHLVKFQDIAGLRLGQAVSHLRQPPEFFLATRPRWGATRRKPGQTPRQSLQRYSCLPDALRPFLTMFVLWQARHAYFIAIWIIGLWHTYNVTYQL